MSKLLEIPLDQIQIIDRARDDYGDIESLAESIKVRGLIQPILLNQDLVLCDGGRRVEAFQMLNKETIPAIVRDTDGQVEVKELELLGNFARKDFNWHERCKLISDIHTLKQSQDTKWSIRSTAAMLGMSKSLIDNQLKLANYTESMPDLINTEKESDAWKAINILEEKLVLNELAKRTQEDEEIKQAAKEKNDEEIQDLLSRVAEARGVTVDDMYQELEDSKHGGSLYDAYKIQDFFVATEDWEDSHLGKNCIVECDPPYGIDLHQRKREASTEDYNEVDLEAYPDFLQRLMERLYRVMGDDSTMIFWFAIEWWHVVTLYAEQAGFRVNLIPGIWYKTNFAGQNMQPNYNLSNVYETFIVCRKGSSNMGKPGSSNVFLANPVPGNQKVHPTEKPVDLIKKIIESVALTPPTVQGFVPFLGSGNSLFAFRELRIPSFGFDLSEAYRNKFLYRLEKEKE